MHLGMLRSSAVYPLQPGIADGRRRQPSARCSRASCSFLCLKLQALLSIAF